MSPASLSAKFVEKIPLFRGDASREVSAYARHLASAHVLNLPATAMAPGPLVAASPCELSEQLLQALFGRWPPGQPLSRRNTVKPLSGVSVSHVDWSEWCAATAADNALNGSSAP